MNRDPALLRKNIYVALDITTLDDELIIGEHDILPLLRLVNEYLESADCSDTIFLATFLVSYLVSSETQAAGKT